MAALRKKYQGRGLEDDGKTAPSVSVPPSAGAHLPPIDDSPRPADLAPETDAAEEAAQSAIKQRLAELEQAEAFTQQEQPQFATEPQPQQPSPLEQALAAAPEAARGWLRSHSEYLTDPEQNAHLQSAHSPGVRRAKNSPRDTFARWKLTLACETKLRRSGLLIRLHHGRIAAPQSAHRRRERRCHYRPADLSATCGSALKSASSRPRSGCPTISMPRGNGG